MNRNAGQKGYCCCDAGYHIASICLHKGEEPVINGPKGICNVFFSGCNLSCSFCQNFQISRRESANSFLSSTLRQISDAIIDFLDQGIEAVGFVSPTHQVPQVKSIIKDIHASGRYPIFVYNTNGFDKVEIIKSLEGLIDVYLPDFKYLDPTLARNFSDAESYPEIAKAAIKEMYRQKGSTLVVSDTGQAITGLIIRHLVLPGQSMDSIKILNWIAEELSTDVSISLMSQYYPTLLVKDHSVLGKHISAQEYEEVLHVMENLGFHKGWIQEYGSSGAFQPDFTRKDPFIILP
jgi:putative pyruvate formate lyase activating enzyme